MVEFAEFFFFSEKNDRFMEIGFSARSKGKETEIDND